jgi:hypothetical protein
MLRATSSWRWLPVCVVLLTIGLNGCGGSNSNEVEYLRNTSPGTPAEPESVASRRERTKSKSSMPAKGKAKRSAGEN